MKTIRGCALWVAVAVAVALLVAAGCGEPASIGERIRQDGETARARIQADSDRYAAEQETVRNGHWVGVTPVLAIILVGGVAFWLFVWWSGKITLRRVELGAQPSPPAYPALPQPPPAVLLEAQRHNALPLLAIDGRWMLVDATTGRLVARQKQITG